jgi:hypothetical protein
LSADFGFVQFIPVSATVISAKGFQDSACTQPFPTPATNAAFGVCVANIMPAAPGVELKYSFRIDWAGLFFLN